MEINFNNAFVVGSGRAASCCMSGERIVLTYESGGYFYKKSISQNGTEPKIDKSEKTFADMCLPIKQKLVAKKDDQISIE